MFILYRCWDRRGRLLYVGITGDLARRLAEHEVDKAWWPQVTRTTTEEYRTRSEALYWEWVAISCEFPLHNRHHSGGTPPPPPPGASLTGGRAFMGALTALALLAGTLANILPLWFASTLAAAVVGTVCLWLGTRARVVT